MALTLNGSTGLSGIVGSAATPALQGTDTNTGYFFGTDTLGLSTGGSQRLTIDSSGNVGIASTPTARLDVRRSDTDGKIAEFHQSTGYGIDIGSSTSDAYISSGYNQKFHLKTDAAGGAGQETRLTIIQNGNVGINNTAPNSILHIGAADNTNHEAILTLNNGGASGQEAGIEWLYEASTTPRAKIHLNASDQSLTFSTANSTALTIDSSQNVKIIDGDLIIGTNGHGIDFSATESGNVISGGSKLDDYEEGIYTPTITGASGSWTLHTNYNKLSYTKIGRMVHFSGYISIDGESSPSGNINVSLPFTVGANTGTALNKYSAVTISLRSHGSTNITNVIGAPQPATTYMNILSVHPDGSHTWMTHSDVDTEWNLRIGGSFYV